MTLSFDPNQIALARGHFIDGSHVPGEAEMSLQRPSDGHAFTDVPVADAMLVDAAVASAHRALKSSGWGACPPRDRVRALHAWADLIEAEAATLAQLEAVCSTRLISQMAAGDIAGLTHEAASWLWDHAHC